MRKVYRSEKEVEEAKSILEIDTTGIMSAIHGLGEVVTMTHQVYPREANCPGAQIEAVPVLCPGGDLGNLGLPTLKELESLECGKVVNVTSGYGVLVKNIPTAAST